MPRSLAIKLLIAFPLGMICFSLFVLGLLNVINNAEYLRLANDNSVTITPEEGKSYHIAIESGAEFGG